MDIERDIRTQVSSSDLNPSQGLIQSINDGETPLLAVVKGLGEFLTSPEDNVRVKGLTFLSNTIAAVNKAKINGPATRTLTGFFSSKLDDFDSLPPALTALLELSKLPTFDDGAAVDVYKSIVETVNLKAYTQAVRHQVYVLFDSLLAKHRGAFKAINQEFISSYTKVIDGEKDPRNLMLLFQLDKVILDEFDVEAQIEELYDVTFCYFPITFRPPPNDPYGITSDDLKIALRNCLSASPYFAKMALPLFLEKYPTSAGQTMRDLMQTMAACFPVYGAEAVGERGEELFDCLKTEILYSSDQSIENSALQALESLVRTLYPTQSDAPKGLGEVIVKQSLEGLSDPLKNHSPGCAKCLASMVRASPSAGAYALAQALPQLFRDFNEPKLPSHRVPLINTITTLLLAARSVYAAEGATRRQSEEHSLDRYRDPLLDVMREGLRTDNLKTAAIRGSVAMAEIPDFLDALQIEELVRGIDNLLVNDGDSDVRKAALTGLKSIATSNPHIVQSSTLPLLFLALPESAPAADDSKGREDYRNVLKSLTELCVSPALFQTLLVRITTKLDMISSQPDATAASEGGPSRHECNTAYAWDLLHTVKVVLDEKLEKKHVDVPKYYSEIVPRFFQLVLIASQQPGRSLFRDPRLISAVADITETLFWEQSSEKQKTIFETAYNGFEQGSLEDLVYDPKTIRKGTPPLAPIASGPEKNLIVLYTALVRGLKPATVLPFTDLDAHLDSKVAWAIRGAQSEYQLRAVLDMICAFVNKHAKELASLSDVLEQIWVKEVQDTAQPAETRRRALLVYFHIVKALALLRSDLAYSAMDRVVDILSLADLDSATVLEAAQAFGILAESGKSTAKGRSHLTVKLLYAQKLWSFLLPKLLAGERDATGAARAPYLVAFASLLPLVPASLYLADLPKLLPVLLRALALPHAAQRVNVLVALTSVLETASSSTATDALLHAQAETIVGGLLAAAARGEGSTGKVRTAALAALGVVPDAIRYETLHTAKARVVRELGRSLDDPLRAVRREAVDTRAAWYTYGNGA